MDENTLNQILECSVCLERLDIRSKVLPCQHTFCRKCLEEIVASKQELRCPECRVLVNSSVDALPPNVLLMRILGGIKSTDHPGSATMASDQAPVSGGRSIQPPVKDQLLKTSPQQILPRNAGPGHQTPHKFPTQNVCHAKALFDFQSNINGDLTFRKGDVIVLRRRIDQNWFYGQLNEREGAFPVNHVQIIVPLPVPQCKAVYDFRMGPNEEDGCLTFKKGQIINVTRRVDQNWAEGRIGECVGIFPINFVEMNGLAKQLMENEKAVAGDNCRVPPPAPSTPATGDERLQHVSQLRLGNGHHPVVTRSHNHGCGSGGAVSGHKRTSDNRHSTELVLNTTPISGGDEAGPASTSVNNTRRPSGDGRGNKLSPIYVALFPYKPLKSDELELIKGEQYFVTERCQDGWFKGMNQARNSGVFPGNYVAPLKVRRSEPVTVCSPSPANATGNVLQSGVTAPMTGDSNRPPPPGPPTPQGVIQAPPTLPPRNILSSWAPYNDLFGRKTVHSPTETSAATTTTTTNITTANDREKKEHSNVNLIKRLTNNLKRSKSPPSSSYSLDNPVFEDNNVSAATQSPAQQHHDQVHLPQAVHTRSGSCPSQLLQLNSSNACETAAKPLASVQGGQHGPHKQIALVYGSQRMRGHKERPTLHYMHRQFSERQEDLTTIKAHGNCHRKTQSLDAGKIMGDGAGSKARSQAPPGNHQYQQAAKERFRCIVAYPPNSEYELELNVGDQVLVNKKRENGWYRGTHLRTGKSGLFPASFVEPDLPQC